MMFFPENAPLNSIFKKLVLDKPSKKSYVKCFSVSSSNGNQVEEIRKVFPFISENEIYNELKAKNGDVEKVKDKFFSDLTNSDNILLSKKRSFEKEENETGLEETNDYKAKLFIKQASINLTDLKESNENNIKPILLKLKENLSKTYDIHGDLYLEEKQNLSRISLLNSNLKTSIISVHDKYNDTMNKKQENIKLQKEIDLFETIKLKLRSDVSILKERVKKEELERKSSNLLLNNIIK